MTQAQTLQDIYSKIADIKDVLCAGLSATSSEVDTQILNEFSINPNTWEYSPLSLENTSANATVTLAQTELNQMIGLALGVAKSERAANDPMLTLSDGAIVPIATNTPIMLLPKLLKALVQFKAPLSVVTKIVSELVSDALLEHIKRKLAEKQGEIFGYQSIANSAVIAIPSAATHLLTYFDYLPAWVGKEYELEGFNKSGITTQANPAPDLARYSTYHTPTISFGRSLTGPIADDIAFWDKPVDLEFSRQIFKIPDLEPYSNIKKFVYCKSKVADTTAIAFMRSL